MGLVVQPGDLDAVQPLGGVLDVQFPVQRPVEQVVVGGAVAPSAAVTWRQTEGKNASIE